MVVVKDYMIKAWRESGDELMMRLYDEYLGKEIPSEEEVESWITFFATFCIGSASIGLKDLSERYAKRLELYYGAVEKMGFESGWVNFSRWDKRRKALDKIMAKAARNVNRIVRKI